jgi:hypothetical protein
MNSDNRSCPRQWASGMDRLFANRRFVAIFGQLHVPSRSELIDALATIAAAGSKTRLTLVPQAEKRVWTSGVATPVVHELPEAIFDEDSAAILQFIRRRPGYRHPLEIHVSERLIALDVDHGLGDGRFALELISTLFAYAHGRTTPWATTHNTSLAMPRALLRTFACHPSHAAAALMHLAGRRPADRGDSRDATGRCRPWSPSPAVSVAHISVDAESAVDEWRLANCGASGSAAVWLYIVRQALAAAGLAITDKAIVAIDCRRYLPTGSTAGGNFAFGVDLPFTADDTSEILSRRLRQLTVVGVPLAGMAAVSAYGLLVGKRKQTQPLTCIPSAPADLMYSDMGSVTSIEDEFWRDEERFIAGLLDPAGPNSVSVLNTQVGATRHISISFHDNVIDRSVIDNAANLLKRPFRLLLP